MSNIRRRCSGIRIGLVPWMNHRVERPAVPKSKARMPPPTFRRLMRENRAEAVDNRHIDHFPGGQDPEASVHFHRTVKADEVGGA